MFDVNEECVVVLRALIVVSCSAVLLGAAVAPTSTPTASALPIRLSFVPHAALFSLGTRQAALIDPEVFVAAPNAQAALGFLQIAHVSGERNAEMSDDSSAQALDANARPLGFDLQHWFAANGVIQIDPPDLDHGSAQSVIVRFANLIPRGRYSVFVAHTETKATMVPLDGSAKSNSFTADGEGNAGATIVSPQPLPHGAAIMLVFHADHKDHGFKVGDLGFDAFHQLVVRIP
jgi:hypothetical protein